MEKNVNFAHKIREDLSVEVFSQNDLKALLHPMSDASIHNGISRALKSKDLIKLKRGLYLFSKRLRKGPVSKLLIANKMYGPSYVSLEFALSHHEMIPEAVYTTTSACYQRKTKVFKNELGDFTYEYIPCSDFFLGVSHDKTKGGVLIASPLRALLDLIYLRKKKYQSVDQMEQDLRIEVGRLKEEINKYSVNDIEMLAQQYKKRNIIETYKLLIKAFK